MFDYSFMNDKAKELFTEYLEFEYDMTLQGARATESPIEQIMWVLVTQLTRDINFYPETQKTFEINGRNYRTDITIMQPGAENEVLCIIECDGHEFHEKTKAQVQRDRSRDRAFQSIGIPVFRFTGSEIYNKPYECKKEIRKFLKKMIAG